MSVSSNRWTFLPQVASFVCLMIALGSSAFAQDTSAPEINPFKEFTEGERLASLGGYTKAIPHFERALIASPVQYAMGHYNLGEIYRAKGQCPQALLHYQIFLRKENQEQDRLKRARNAMRQCAPTLATMPTLSVDVVQPGTTVMLDKWQLPGEAMKEPMKVPAGKHSVTAQLPDHISQSRTFALKAGEGRSEAFDLERQTLFGSLKVSASVPNATFVLRPKKMDRPGSEPGPVDLVALQEQGVKLPTGKYFLEVSHPEYNRWIRNVDITRENQTTINVILIKALPSELRAQDPQAPRP